MVQPEPIFWDSIKKCIKEMVPAVYVKIFEKLHGKIGEAQKIVCRVSSWSDIQ